MSRWPFSCLLSFPPFLGGWGGLFFLLLPFGEVGWGFHSCFPKQPAPHINILELEVWWRFIAKSVQKVAKTCFFQSIFTLFLSILSIFYVCKPLIINTFNNTFVLTHYLEVAFIIVHRQEKMAQRQNAKMTILTYPGLPTAPFEHIVQCKE